MGWGNCGEDSQGRPIGYVFEGVCDHEGCSVQINRGLSYACGDMHGAADCYCEKYFCSEHLTYAWSEDGEEMLFDKYLCFKCSKDLEEYHKENCNG